MFQMCLQNQKKKKKSLDPDFIYLNFKAQKLSMKNLTDFLISFSDERQ